MQVLKVLACQRKKLFIKSVTEKTDYEHRRGIITGLYKRKTIPKTKCTFYPYAHETAYIELDSLVYTN